MVKCDIIDGEVQVSSAEVTYDTNDDAQRNKHNGVLIEDMIEEKMMKFQMKN